jgi:outer membrane protein assembly factor BamB
LPAGDVLNFARANTSDENWERPADMPDAPVMPQAGDGVALRRSIAGTAAIVAGVFCVICAIMLAGLWLKLSVFQVGNPLNDPQMALLKRQLFAEPANQSLRLRIQELDYRLRSDFFLRQRMLSRGAWLLLGGLAVLVLAGKYTVMLGQKPPHPKPGPVPSAQRSARLARWSVGGVGGVLGCAILVWAGIANESLPRPGAAQMQADNSPIAQAATYPTDAEVLASWPYFRGPGGAGISASAEMPQTWDGSAGLNIIWKSPVGLPGHSSPVIWGDRIFLTGADKDSRAVYCLSRDTGELLWRHDVNIPGSSLAKKIDDQGAGYAAPTPACDGKRVYAIFANGNLVCCDFAGKQVWQMDLKPPDSSYGYASSLTMWRNLLLVLYDQGSAEDGKSKLLAIDGASGRVVWQVRRAVPASWATPIVIQTKQGVQIITCADPWVIAYNPSDGKELWRAACLGQDVAPSPVFAGGLVLAVQQGSQLSAIKPDGRGDVTKTHIAWKADEGLPDICSPLSDGKLTWLVGSFGSVTCYDAADGKVVWQKDIDAEFHASPSLVGDKVLLVGLSGEAFILQAGREYKLLGKASLGERCDTTPAMVGGRIYIRGQANLYCIGAGLP